MYQGKKKITLSYYLKDKELTISINNNGRTMSKELINNIFRPYYSNKSCGTGMGMAICKKIVEAHGGKIKVASNENRGTTFEIILPITFN